MSDTNDMPDVTLYDEIQGHYDTDGVQDESGDSFVRLSDCLASAESWEASHKADIANLECSVHHVKFIEGNHRAIFCPQCIEEGITKDEHKADMLALLDTIEKMTENKYAAQNIGIFIRNYRLRIGEQK